MQDLERRDATARDWPGDPADEAGPDREVSAEHQGAAALERRAQSADRARELLAWEPG